MWANSTLRWLLILMLLCLFVALVFSSCFPAECPTTKPIAVVPSFSETVEKVMPSVVYIFVEVEAGLRASAAYVLVTPTCAKGTFEPAENHASKKRMRSYTESSPEKFLIPMLDIILEIN